MQSLFKNTRLLQYRGLGTPSSFHGYVHPFPSIPFIQCNSTRRAAQPMNISSTDFEKLVSRLNAIDNVISMARETALLENMPYFSKCKCVDDFNSIDSHDSHDSHSSHDSHDSHEPTQASVFVSYSLSQLKLLRERIEYLETTYISTNKVGYLTEYERLWSIFQFSDIVEMTSDERVDARNVLADLIKVFPAHNLAFLSIFVALRLLDE